MPYIKQERRKDFDPMLDDILARVAQEDINCGDLNYIFTKLAIAYFNTRGNYQAANDIDGALGCASKEFYRRRTESYEDQKISANGDVY